jgi:hypothetical protein
MSEIARSDAAKGGSDKLRAPSATSQLLATGLFVECIFSCPSCGLSGSSIARPAMLEGKTCARCGDPVLVTAL